MTARTARGVNPQQIEDTARRLMAVHGTAGLTLRGIARQLGVTAPAIYNYYPRLENLITALITSAFTSLAEAMEAADARSADANAFDRILAMCLAYRQWAIVHPTDFQLIYGNPIPGYSAPTEITIPLARRPFLGLFSRFLEAYRAGDLVIPAEYQVVPGSVQRAIDAWRQESGMVIPEPLLCVLMSGWARIHGLVMLELFHHIQPLVGEGADFYRHEVEGMLKHLGLQTSSVDGTRSRP